LNKNIFFINFFIFKNINNKYLNNFKRFNKKIKNFAYQKQLNKRKLQNKLINKTNNNK